MKRFLLNFYKTLFSVTLFSNLIFSQPELNMNSSEIFLSLNKLKTLNSVLYIAAHPDDENTAALTYFSKHELARTGYLSLTRGDGGQNLIGNEQQNALGIIRTNELLEARKIDGAKQFFTRAIDFGYSKSAEESFRKWNKDEILADIVWVIRNFKPDIIVTRFPANGGGGHGHHTASAILAEEAFYAAADSTKFSAQLNFVDTWKTQKLFWNAWPQLLTERKIDLAKVAQIDVGKYNPLLGRSYTEISSQSRSMHKSQGFGAVARREANINYFLRIDEPNDTSNLFKGINRSWKKIKGAEKISAAIDKIISEYDFAKPEKSISALTNLWKSLSKFPEENFYVKIKMEEVKELIKHCSGLWLEATADKFEIVSGETLKVNLKVVNRSGITIHLRRASVNYEVNIPIKDYKLLPMQVAETNLEIPITESTPYSQPFWLKEESNENLFSIDLKDVGRANSDNVFNANYVAEFNGVQIIYEVPVYYRWTDPINGEMFRDVEVLPSISVEFEKDFFIIDSSKENAINVVLKNRGNKINGKLVVNSSKKHAVSSTVEIDLEKDEEKVVPIKLNVQSDETVQIHAELICAGGQKYSSSPKRISYSHFLPQPYLKRARANVLSFNKIEGDFRIAYLAGSGDEIPAVLRELGYRVDLFSDVEIQNIIFENYNCIIAGIRFLNTNSSIKKIEAQLFQFAETGGTLIYQYNTLQTLKTDRFGAYDLKIGRERVAEENASVTITNPEHPLLNFPNKISESDFDGYVQERGLYFPSEWNEKYETILSMNDKNEKPLSGAILFANYGSGKFIYTSLSFFRQLPVLNTGAIKIFQNMIHANDKK